MESRCVLMIIFDRFPDDFSKETKKYIKNYINKHCTSDNEFVQMFDYETGTLLSPEQELSPTGGYMIMEEYTNSKKYGIVQENYPECQYKYFVKYEPEEGKKIAAIHNHPENLGDAYPSDQDFDTLLSFDYFKYSVIFNSNYIWILEDFGTDNDNKKKLMIKYAVHMLKIKELIESTKNFEANRLGYVDFRNLQTKVVHSNPDLKKDLKIIEKKVKSQLSNYAASFFENPLIPISLYIVKVEKINEI